MMNQEPIYSRNAKVEYVLRDTTSKSGYSHHCGYVKRSHEQKRLFRKSVMLYDIVETTKEGRLLWHNIPENDILGIVEYKKDKAPAKEQLEDLQNKYNKQ